MFSSWAGGDLFVVWTTVTNVKKAPSVTSLQSKCLKCNHWISVRHHLHHLQCLCHMTGHRMLEREGPSIHPCMIQALGKISTRDKICAAESTIVIFNETPQLRVIRALATVYNHVHLMREYCNVTTIHGGLRPHTPQGCFYTYRNPAWNMYIRGPPELAYLGAVKMKSFFIDT